MWDIFRVDEANTAAAEDAVIVIVHWHTLRKKSL